MKRFAAVIAVVGAAFGTVSASSVGASQPARVRLKGLVCQHALDPPARGISITAVMRPVSGTRKMRMRFQLLHKPKGAGVWGTVSGGDLGSWISPANATLGQRSGDVWIVHKQVVNLAAPAAYRFRVSFKWFGAHGRVLVTTTRLSDVCSQPELRPDLLVKSITVQSVMGRAHENRYVAVIRNAGATDAGPFDILFAPGGALPTRTVSVSGLAAHSQVRRSFVGPVCSNAAATTVTVDPQEMVDDFNRSNNSMTAVCPGTTGA